MEAAFDDVLCARAFDALCEDVRRYIDAVDAGYDASTDDVDDDVDAGATLTSSFWMPMTKVASPQNAIEAYIASLARSDWFGDYVGACARASSARVRPTDNTCASDADLERCAGAEWWIQDVAWDEPPKVYHTDCDVRVVGETSRRAYPVVASVTYVSSGGGPTVVFAQTCDAIEHGALDPVVPGEITACAPVANRLMVFKGDRWHGVLREPDDSTFRGQRVTVLVNWWLDQPSGARALPRRFAREDDDFSKYASSMFAFGARRVVRDERMARDSYARDARAWDDQRAPVSSGSSCATFVYGGDDAQA